MSIGKKCVQICGECGEPYLVISKYYAGCPMGHGKLTAFFTLRDEEEEESDDII